MSNSNSGKLLAGLVLGAIAGAAAGILLAPDKGTVTQDKLKKKANDLKEDLDKYAQDFSEKAKSFADDVERKLKETSQKQTQEDDFNSDIGI